MEFIILETLSFYINPEEEKKHAGFCECDLNIKTETKIKLRDF